MIYNNFKRLNPDNRNYKIFLPLRVSFCQNLSLYKNSILKIFIFVNFSHLGSALGPGGDFFARMSLGREAQFL